MHDTHPPTPAPWHLLALGTSAIGAASAVQFPDEKVECQAIAPDADLLVVLTAQPCDLILCDAEHAARVLCSVRERQPTLPVVVVAESSPAITVREVVDLMRQGAHAVVEQGDSQRLAELVREGLYAGRSRREAGQRELAARKQAEKVLAASEARYRQFFEMHGLPKLLIDMSDGRIIDANAAATIFYGCERAALLSRTVYDLADASAEVVRDRLSKGAAKQIFSFDSVHHVAQGERREVEVFTGPLELDGKVLAYAIIIDQTERNQTKAELEAALSQLELYSLERTLELARTRDQLAAVFTHSGDAIVLLNVQHGIQQANEAFAHLFATRTQDCLNRPLTDFFQPEMEAELRTAIEAAATRHRRQQIEARARRGEGSSLDVEIGIAPVNRTAEPVVNLVCIIRDVTERKQADMVLRRYAAEIEDLYNNSPAGYHSLDKEGVFVRINDTELRWLGRTREEVIGKLRFLDVCTPASRETFKKNYPIFLDRGWVKDLEFEVVRKDGSTFHIVLNAVAVYDDNGRYVYSRSNMYDVTDLRRAQQAVAEEGHLLRTLIDAVPEFIYIKDTEHRLKLSNAYHMRSLGVARTEDIVGKTDLDFFPPEMVAKFHADEDELFRTGQPIVDTEERSLGKDRQEMWALTTKVPLRNLDGEIVGLVGSTRDITYRKVAEEALRRSQADLLSVIDSTDTGFILLDRDGKLRLANRLAKEFSRLGYGLELVEGNPLTDYLAPPAHDLFWAQHGAAMRGQNSQFEVAVPVAGQTRQYEFRYFPVRAADGEIMGVNIAFEDVTERKEAEQKLRYLASLQAHMADAVAGMDLGFRVLSWNRAAERMYGWTAEEAIGRTTMDLLRTDPHSFVNSDGMPISRDEALRVLMEVGHWMGEITHYHRDGRRLVTSSSVIVNTDEHGQPVGLIGVSRDITAQKEAEQKLRYLASLQEYMYDGVIGLDLEFHILSWNKAAERMYGWTAAEAIGRYSYDVLRTDLISLISPEGKPMTRDQAVEIVFTQGHWSGEVVHYHRNGTPIHVLTSIVMTFDDHGRRTGMIRVNHDITARKEAEQKLRYLASLQEYMYEGVGGMTLDFQLQTWNKAAERIYGWSAEEAIGRPGNEVVQTDDESFVTLEGVAMHRSEAMRILFERGYWNGEVTHHHRSGRALQILTSLALSRDEHGQPNGIIGVTHDITARKEAEQKLRYLASLQEYMYDAVVGLNLETHVLSWNKAAERMFGWSAAEALGRPIADFLRTDFSPITRDAALQILMKQDHWRGEVVQFHRDGTPIHILLSVVLNRDEHGQPVGIIGVSHDISVRKRAEVALRQALEHEKELGDLKSRFISMASHEFRTPLTTILTTAESLLNYRTRFDETQINRRLERIREQVGHMENVMEDVLQLARIQAGHIDFKPAPGNLTTLCRDIIEEFHDQARYHGRIQATMDLTLGVFPFDKRLIRQLISNLIANALKYSPTNNAINLRLTHNELEITLEVEDKGIGVPSGDLKHLFKPFHRGANVNNIPGTGLGLSIAKLAAELHGGSIAVQSELDRGTTFTVILPKVLPKELRYDQDPGD